MCRGGKLIGPCRVRREWSGMLPGERWNELFYVMPLYKCSSLTPLSVQHLISFNCTVTIKTEGVYDLVLVFVSPCVYNKDSNFSSVIFNTRVLVWLWFNHMTFAQYTNVQPNKPTSWTVTVVACFEIYLFLNLTGIALF